MFRSVASRTSPPTCRSTDRCPSGRLARRWVSSASDSRHTRRSRISHDLAALLLSARDADDFARAAALRSVRPPNVAPAAPRRRTTSPSLNAPTSKSEVRGQARRTEDVHHSPGPVRALGQHVNLLDSLAIAHSCQPVMPFTTSPTCSARSWTPRRPTAPERMTSPMPIAAGNRARRSSRFESSGRSREDDLDQRFIRTAHGIGESINEVVDCRPCGRRCRGDLSVPI